MSDVAVDPGETEVVDAPVVEPEDTPVVESNDDDWRASIKDEKLRDHAGRYTSIEAMTKANLDFRREISKAVVPLGKNPTDEQIAAYRKSIGVPETPDGYEFAVPEGYEPTESDIAFQKAAAELFHQENIPAETAKNINEWWGEITAAARQAQIEEDAAYADAAVKALKKEWPGEEFNRNKAFADQAATKLFGDQLDEIRAIETRDGRFVLDHPAFVKMMAQYGREMQEGKLGTVMTDSERGSIDREIDELQGKIEKAQRDGDRSTANTLYQAQQELYRKSYGSGPVVGSEGRAV